MSETIEYKGVEYRKVIRFAQVGELVFVFDHPVGINGVFTVDRTRSEGHIYFGEYGRKPFGYYVLEPIPKESPLTESDLIANLALRVAELERAEIRSMHEAEASAYAKYGNPYEEQTEVGADNVNHPSHYTQGGVEVIDIIAQITRGYTDGFHAYCVGNALKYLARAPYKHATIDEDVRKAAKYIEFITEDKGAI